MVLDVHIHKHSEFSSSLKFMLSSLILKEQKFISSYSSAQWWSNTKFMSGIRPLNLEPIEHNHDFQKLLNIKSFGSQINQYNWIYNFLYK